MQSKTERGNRPIKKAGHKSWSSKYKIHVVHDFEVNKTNFDLVAVNETWLNNEIQYYEIREIILFETIETINKGRPPIIVFSHQ